MGRRRNCSCCSTEPDQVTVACVRCVGGLAAAEYLLEVSGITANICGSQCEDLNGNWVLDTRVGTCWWQGDGPDLLCPMPPSVIRIWDLQFKEPSQTASGEYEIQITLPTLANSPSWRKTCGASPISNCLTMSQLSIPVDTAGTYCSATQPILVTAL